MNEQLRHEVRFLTTRLGVIVQEQCGPHVFSAIENLRTLAKRIRQHPDLELLRAKEEEVRRLSIAQASDVAHAFSLFFHLVNLCEERERIRRLHAYEQRESGAPMSLRHTFLELCRHQVPASAVRDLLTSMHIEPVLTAHPTEAKRRSVLNHILRLSRTLEGICGEFGAAAARAVDPWVEALWLTDEVRERPVTPQMESENARFFLERTIYDLAGTFWEKFREELGLYYPEVQEPAPFLSFGSWVGTDRDGNPYITPATSLDAAEHLRRSILRYYRAYCERMLTVMSFPCRDQAQFRREIEREMRRFPPTRAFERIDQPSELFRRKVRIIAWRLDRSLERSKGAYVSPQEFTRDLARLEHALGAYPSPRVAEWGPGRLRVASQVFGFHGVSLDFRTHAFATRAAADEILSKTRHATAPEAARIRSVQKCLLKAPKRMRFSTGTQKVLDDFAALKEIQTRNGEAAARRFILSMTASAADVWDVLLLAHYVGLVQARAGKLRSYFDVVPLFETLDDLAAGPAILERLFKDPLYRRVLKSRGDYQEVMLGYSDSVKDGGYVAANWALFHAQKRLAQAAERHGVRFSLFHGKGGTIDRGGGQSHRSIQAQPHAAPGGRLRITEQGEVISLKYANVDIAVRNLEQLVTAVLDAHLLHFRRVDTEHLPAWEKATEELAAHGRDFYRELVYRTPGFVDYFRQATPIDLIEQIRLGSRPSRRLGSRDLQDLRAIPWIFAWTQSRHLLPAWYGLGYALEKFITEHAPHALELLRAMYKGWPFFSILITNAETSLAKTDLYIASRYAGLVRPRVLGQTIFGRIREEYERSVRMVLELSQSKHLLERQPVLAESIRLRNPYVDPLNFLQTRFLEAWRRSRPREGVQPLSDPLLRLLQITVGGIAFGMKSTG